MYKASIYLILFFFLSACHIHKTQTVSPAPEQQSVTEEISSLTPQPETLASDEPNSRVNTTAPQTISDSQKEPIPAISAANAVSEPIPEAPKVVPAPDQPVFKGEELIHLTDRLLPPYAALIPDIDTPQPVPWAYEQLKYGLYYGFIKAGTSYIRNRGLVDINGHSAYFIQTSAFSAAVIDAVFKVRDINYSWIDATHFYSYGYGQSVREGNYKRDEWLEFDYPAKKYFGQIQKKAAPKNISGPLDIHVLDMLGALYYVRAQELEVGSNITFDIINREKQYPLLVKVLKKETVKTSAGKFDCIVVEPQLRGEGIFVSKGKSLKVWLTDDKYKMPVKMTVEVFIGSVSAELLEYKRQAPTNIL